MKTYPIWLLAIGVALLSVACLSPDKGDFDSGEPNVYFYQVDKIVPSEAVQKVLRTVLEAAPQLREIREQQEKAAGGSVHLNLSLLNAPDPKAMGEPDRSYYRVYVNTRGDKGLIGTYYFVVKQDLSDVGVFDKSGDVVLSVPQWLAEQGAGSGRK